MTHTPTGIWTDLCVPIGNSPDTDFPVPSTVTVYGMLERPLLKIVTATVGIVCGREAACSENVCLTEVASGMGFYKLRNTCSNHQIFDGAMCEESSCSLHDYCGRGAVPWIVRVLGYYRIDNAAEYQVRGIACIHCIRPVRNGTM